MDGLIIKIDWPYFLGIMGSLIAIAFYSGGWVSKINTLMTEISRRLTILEGRLSGTFQNESPISLTVRGTNLLEGSGLKEYIDNNGAQLISDCKGANKLETPYDVQGAAFRCFDELRFSTEFENKLKEFAYQEGVDMPVLRRVGGIYFRGVLLKELKMEEKDIDKQKPQ